MRQSGPESTGTKPKTSAYRISGARHAASHLIRPKVLQHSQSGQAVVYIDGRDLLLGDYNTDASREKYNRTIAEWIANGRRLPTPPDETTVLHVIDRFWEHAQVHYRKPVGTPTSEQANIRDALRPVKKLYGRLAAAEFSPLKLKAVRDEMIRMKWCRTNINRAIGRVKLMFKWATENELVCPAVYHGLQAVAGLKEGRSAARESEPVKRVAEAHVDAIEHFVSRQVWAMIQLQQLTGMRSGEVCSMRRRNIDTSGKLWLYRPEQHKTQHHGRSREIPLGERAEAILGLFLKPDLDAFLFSPADAKRERREKMHAARKTPISCGNKPGTNRKGKPKKKPGDRYTVESYCQRIHHACDKADLWAKGAKVVGNDERVIPPLASPPAQAHRRDQHPQGLRA